MLICIQHVPRVQHLDGFFIQTGMDSERVRQWPIGNKNFVEKIAGRAPVDSFHRQWRLLVGFTGVKVEWFRDVTPLLRVNMEAERVVYDMTL